jgi:hypothetical protein
MAGEALLTRSSNRWRVAKSEAAIQDSPGAAQRRQPKDARVFASGGTR